MTEANLRLFNDLSYLTCTYRTATFADSEFQTLFHSDGLDQNNRQRSVIARHHHLSTRRQRNLPGDVRSTEIELGTILVKERSVTATFFLAQNVHFTLELGVRSDGAGFAKNHTTTDLGLFNTTEQQTGIVTSFTLIQQLTEHFNTRYRGAQRSILQTNDLDSFTYLDTATLDTTRSNRTTTRDGEDVFNRHQEGLINRAGRQRDVAVDSCHQLVDRLDPLVFTSQGARCRTLDDRGVVTIETIRGQQLTDFHLNQFQQLGIINKVNLVHEYHDTGYTHLAGKQDVLLRLGHRAVSRGNYQDCAVHLCSTRDHILYIVSVTRTVNVSIVTVSRLILNVCCIDGNTPLFFFRCSVDLVIFLCFSQTSRRKDGGNSSSQSGLTMVYVTNRTNVNVGFVPLEGLF
ncbi:MAG TPA: hypothetical protein VHE34_06975 [Puia sp.]|nr:hypothetical protein [Puia sp.]